MLNLLKVLFAVTLTILTIPAAGFAQQTAPEESGRGRFSVTGLFGAQWFVDNDFSAQGFTFSEVESLWGWQVAYRFHRNWSVEGGWTGSKTRAILVGKDVQADVDPMFINGNVVFHIPALKRMGPYVTAGLGAAVLDIDRGDDGFSEVNIAGNFGGGLLVPMNDWIAFRTDIRTFLFKVGGLNPVSAAALGVESGRLDEMIRDVKFTFGVTLSL
jgi:hypothetical protein